MEDIVKAAKALVTYIDEELVFDTMNDDGDGYTDGTQSWKFKDLIEDLKQAIATTNKQPFRLKPCNEPITRR